MNKTTSIVMAFTLLATIAVQAQKKYEKIGYNDVSSEAENITIAAKNAVSTDKATKFDLKIVNKGEDIILFKPEESVLKLGDKELKPKEKWMDIQPTKSEHKVINFEGSGFLVPEYAYEVNGLYKISTGNKSIEAPDFQLPPSQNDFKVGKFNCKMLDLSKETDKTVVKFECSYTGDKIGVINPAKAAVKLPDGTEIANAKANRDPLLLSKGESKRMTLVWERMEGGKATDMQKIKLFILWRTTFVESDAVKLKPVTLNFKINEGESK